jgi:hypothetical protein
MWSAADRRTEASTVPEGSTPPPPFPGERRRGKTETRAHQSSAVNATECNELPSLSLSHLLLFSPSNLHAHMLAPSIVLYLLSVPLSPKLGPLFLSLLFFFQSTSAFRDTRVNFWCTGPRRSRHTHTLISPHRITFTFRPFLRDRHSVWLFLPRFPRTSTFDLFDLLAHDDD